MIEGLPRLMLLTDRSQLRLGRGLAGTVEECVAAGLRRVVVREHDLERAAWTALVDRLLALAEGELLVTPWRSVVVPDLTVTSDLSRETA